METGDNVVPAARSIAGERSALKRGLKLIDLLVEVEMDPVRQKDGLSVSQAALELGVHKSTTSRLLSELAECEYAIPNPGSKRGYRIGPALRYHKTLTTSQRAFREDATPYLQRLVGLTQECAHAAVPMGESALVVDAFETWKALRVVATKGRIIPLHCTSAGKVLLAFGMAEIPAVLSSRTSRTVTSKQVLVAHLNEIKAQGWALDDEENHNGVRCISAPVFGAKDKPVGCIGIDGPVLRLHDEMLSSLAANVVETAAELSAALSSREQPSCIRQPNQPGDK